MKLVFISLILTLFNFSFAAEVKLNEILTPISINKSKDLYKISFMEKNSFYSASKKEMACILKAIKQKKPVSISYDPKKLKILNCQNQI